MKISELIARLTEIQNERGDIVVQLQSYPKEPGEQIVCYRDFFVFDEDYRKGLEGEEETVVNIRPWQSRLFLSKQFKNQLRKQKLISKLTNECTDTICTDIEEKE